MTPKEKIMLPGYYMQWRMDARGNPFEYFEKKYGYKPTLIGIGAGVTVDVPQGMTVIENVHTQAGHIKLR